MMSKPGEPNPEYLHGSDAPEQARLEAMVKILGGAEFLPPLRAGMSILEVGCGVGTIARQVAAKVAPGQVVGVDQQPEQLSTARKLAAKHGIDNIDFQQGRATKLDLPDASFDGVYCRFLLEHVSDPVEVVRQMARMVKPGGWVCAFEWENGCAINYPECPAVRQVWEALYELQADVGGDAKVARKLFDILNRSGLSQVTAEGRAWSIIAEDRGRLQVYVDGAREIIRQSRDRLLSDNRVTGEMLEQADKEYQHLLESSATFIMEGYAFATGTRTDPVNA